MSIELSDSVGDILPDYTWYGPIQLFFWRETVPEFETSKQSETPHDPDGRHAKR